MTFVALIFAWSCSCVNVGFNNIILTSVIYLLFFLTEILGVIALTFCLKFIIDLIESFILQDYPFVVYRNDERNAKVVSGELNLMPTLLAKEYGKNFVRQGSLSLPR